jgi:hypothetical protein
MPPNYGNYITFAMDNVIESYILFPDVVFPNHFVFKESSFQPSLILNDPMQEKCFFVGIRPSQKM